MGLLDDAIREHLELKRLRGSDPDEVARQEREALGPARRAVETPDAAPVVQAENGSLDDAEPVEAVAHDEPLAPEPDEAFVDAAPEAPLAETEEPALGSAEPHAAEPELHIGQETAEFDVEGESTAESAEHQQGALPVEEERPPAPAREGEPPAEGEQGPHPDDVLEETPEFLQETPEHERLWFEQQPPRDFDFDK